MQSSIKISAIIPVYNGVSYLKECLDSIVNQSFSPFEILIIDDGSTDGTWELIQSYVDKYDYIHGFRQERKRQGAARNVGLDHASGELISFIDADDMLPEGAYQSMYKLAQANNSDLVTGIKRSIGIQKRGFFRRQKSWITIPEHQEYFTQVMPDIELKDLPELLVDISVCNKLIRRSFIDQHHFRFIENSAGEDIDFMTRLYLAAEHISVIPKVIYHYCSRPNSRTGRIKPGFFNERVLVTLNLEAAFEAKDLSTLYPFLVLSESRKLVGNRLTRVITNLPYGDQVSIFELIQALLNKLDIKQITSSRIALSSLVSARLLMLSHAQFDALIAYTNYPNSIRYIALIDQTEAKADLLSPLLLLTRPVASKSVSPKKVLLDIRQAISSVLQLLKKYTRKFFRSFGQKSLGYLYFLLSRPYFALFPGVKSKQNIWLMDERVSTSAEDNGYCLFEYLRARHPELEVYFVISKDSPQRAKVESLGNVVRLYSLQHVSLLSQAGILLSTDRFTSLAFPYNIFPRMRRKTHNVFLQHGVAGNKTMTYTRKVYPYFSQVIVSNEIERDFFVKDYHFPEKAVTNTGIARFDKLSSIRAKSRTKKILIAPTWRKWLRESNLIASSQYLYAWNQLMTHPGLDQLAEEHNAELYFRPHFNMMSFIDEFKTDSQYIHILTEKELFLQKYIQDCELLITDYSSVMYDFFFQSKPTICYMFDRKQWELQPPGPPHISFDKDLPADICNTPDLVIQSLAWHLDNNLDMRKKYHSRVPKLITHRDNNNCQRIFESVFRLSSGD